MILDDNRILLEGTALRDRLDVDGNTDGYEIIGFGGHDFLRGGTGDDLISGGSGNDDLRGGSGNDEFLFAGVDGNFDRIVGGAGFDIVSGTSGDDRIGFSGTSAFVEIERIDGGGGSDVLLGSASRDTLDLSGVEVVGITEIDLGAGHDTLTASAFDDVVRGGSGQDNVFGGAGRDTALYSGVFADYTVNIQGNRITVTDIGGHDEGSDTLTDVEVLRFSDGRFENGAFVPDVDPGNEPPVAVADTANTDEDVSVVIDVLANDSDPDGGTLSLSGLAVPGNGTVLDNGDGTVTYTPSANFNGIDNFTYTLSDGQTGQSTGTVTVTVAAQPDVPVSVDDTVTTFVDTSILIAPLANDIEGDGQTLSLVALGTASNGTAVDNGDGTVNYTPSPGFIGTDSFTYTVSDGVDGSDTGTITVDVTSVLSRILLEGTALRDRLDVDGNTDAYEIIGFGGHDFLRGGTGDDLISGGSGNDDLRGGAGNDEFVFDGLDGNFDRIVGGAGFDIVSGTSSDDWIGFTGASAFVEIERIDGGGGSDVLLGSASRDTLDLSGVEVVGITEIDLGAGHDTLTASAFDDVVRGGSGQDNVFGGAGRDTALYSGVFADYTVNIQGNRITVTDIGGHDEGSDTLTDVEVLRFSDGRFENGAFVPDVDPGNEPPVAVADTANTDEDVSVVIDVLANDSDPDGGTLSLSGLAVPGNGTVLDNGDGTVTYTPSANFNGIDNFTYTLSDGQTGQSTGTVTVTVAAQPDVPVSVDDTVTTFVDTSILIAPLANDIEGDGQALSLVALGTASNGTAVDNGDGTVNYTPSPGFIGTDSFTYTVSDGVDGSDTGTITVDVTSVLSRILLEGTALRDRLDVDGNTDAYEIIGFGGHDFLRGGTGDDLISGGSGNDDLRGGAGNDEFVFDGLDGNFDRIVGGAGFDIVSGTSSDDWIGFTGASAFVEIERIDGGGGSDVLLGSASRDTLDLSGVEVVGITEIDLGAGHDTLTASAFDDVVRGGSGQDNVFGGAGRDTALYSGVFADYTVNIQGNRITVTDIGGHDEGSDTLTDVEVLRFSDGRFENGAFVPDVDPGNEPPVAVADTANTDEDVSVVIDVLANDSDPDGGTLSLSGLAVPGNGTVLDNGDGTVTYTPSANFNGIDNFTYTLSDGQTGQSTGTVTVTVAAQPDVPVSVDDTVTTFVDTSILIAPLANDIEGDGQALSLVALGTASNGTAVDNGDGTVNYTPLSGFIGTDSFTYTVSDGVDGSDIGTITVDVTDSSTRPFDSLIAAAPNNSWVKLNGNRFDDVWTPEEQQPGTQGGPHSIVLAWSSMAWDSNRGDVIIWGGGHANYAGNDVYRWSSSSLEWERASLPSEVTNIEGARFEAVDGVFNAPISSHTYDTNVFLSEADKFVVFGGAAAHTGGGFVRDSGSSLIPTGPYFWDPDLANPDEVGGTTGSHVNPSNFPEILGGEMWENRDSAEQLLSIGGTANFVNGTADTAIIGGNETVFISGNPSTGGKLYQYTVADPTNASLDTWEIVGTMHAAIGGKGAGAYSDDHNIYVRSATQTQSGGPGFTYWDLSTSGPSNQNVIFYADDPTGEFVLTGDYGLEYDSKREVFTLWDGDDEIWFLRPPEQLGDQGWLLEQAPDPLSIDNPVVPSQFTGILGKWEYVESHDVYIGLADPNSGDVWAYKPEGWDLIV